MNIQQAKRIPIVDLLETMGYTPTHTTNGGNQVWYRSPLREERTPSFTVNVSGNCWKDFGGTGGNILDLVMEHESTDLRGALSFLDTLHIRPATTTIRKIRQTNSDNSIILQKVKPLTYEPLLEQLAQKGIRRDIAQLHLEEAYYLNGGKRYFGYAMRNDNGGYEIHNKFFKGATLKSPSTLEGVIRTKVCVFEGMTDYLSALQYYNMLSFQYDVIIMHSLSFEKGIIKRMQEERQYQSAYFFLDNDAAGRNSQQRFEESLGTFMTVEDKSDLYEGHNDVNDFWCFHKKGT